MRPAARRRQSQVLGPQPDRDRRPAPVRPQTAERRRRHAHAPSRGCRRDQVDRRRADEAGDEQAVGPVVEVVRRADLLDPALAHADDAVGHGRRLDLVVGDEDRGHAELALQRLDLGAHGQPQRGVEVGERLVEQQELRLLDQRAGERDALLLAAGQLARPAVEQLARPGRARPPPRRGAAASSRGVFLKRSGKRMLSRTRHVRIERVGLEDDADVAVARLDLVDDVRRRTGSRRRSARRCRRA